MNKKNFQYHVEYENINTGLNDNTHRMSLEKAIKKQEDLEQEGHQNIQIIQNF